MSRPLQFLSRPVSSDHCKATFCCLQALSPKLLISDPLTQYSQQDSPNLLPTHTNILLIQDNNYHLVQSEQTFF